jgi:C-terminal processing protease CtpA/Prc
MRLLSRWSALALLLFVLYPAVFAAHSAWALEGDQEIRQDVGDDRLYGIGVFIIDQNGQIVVERSMEGSPAYKAGIRPGDVILSADGYSLRGRDSSAARTKLLGRKSTGVKVSVQRKSDGKVVEHDLVRGYLWD